MPALVRREKLENRSRAGPGPGWSLPERADYRQVLLLADLRVVVRRINPHLPESAIEHAVAAVGTPESPVVMLANRDFHRLLLDGVRAGASAG